MDCEKSYEEKVPGARRAYEEDPSRLLKQGKR